MASVSSIAARLGIALGLVLAVTGLAAAADNNEMIVAGTEATEGKYPYQVRLYTSVNDTLGFCGGSIIAAQWTLTAAHCLSKGDWDGPNTPLDPAAVIVGYGSNDRTKTTKIPAAKIFVRQEYLSKGNLGKGDLALIKLKKPIPDPHVVTIADPETDKRLLVLGTKVVVTG